MWFLSRGMCNEAAKKEIRLDVSKSCQSPEEALLVAEQHGDYPKPGSEPKLSPNVFGVNEVRKV